MWPRPSEALFIGLSSTQVAWQFAGGSPQVEPLSAQSGRFEQIAATLNASEIPSRFAAVNVVAGSSVARHWLQIAPPGLRSLSELQALVQSRADQLFCSNAEWVVAADWHARRPFLCAALPREVDRLASSIAHPRKAALHLTTSLNLSLARHARDLPADGWAILHEPEALHLLFLAAGRLEFFRTKAVDLELGATALQAEVAAEVARSSAMAGGLLESPTTLILMSKDPAASQAGTALSLATRPADRRTI